MRKFHSIAAALCGDGFRPELQALFDRLATEDRTIDRTLAASGDRLLQVAFPSEYRAAVQSR